MKAYVGRALSHCSSWRTTVEELDHVAQTLVDNGYSYRRVAKVTRSAIDRWYLQDNSAPQEKGMNIRLFYRGYMNTEYKKDEAALRNILRAHVTPTEEGAKIDLIIYYKNRKTAQYLMRNSPLPNGSDPLKKRGLVYQILCPANGCRHSYIGMTTTRLSKRIAVHLQEGAVYQHFAREHGTLQRQQLLQKVSILDGDVDHRRLRYKEALCILQFKQSLNVTQETLLLPTTLRRATRRAPATSSPSRINIDTDVSANQQAPLAGAADWPVPTNQPLRRSARLRLKPACGYKYQ